jgi:hypothetical protein
MSVLNPAAVVGRVAAVLVNPDRRAGLAARRVDRADATFAGFAGEAHGGLTRPSCSRTLKQYPRGTPIRNTRQVSILSMEEMAAVGATMGLGGPVEPEWIGGNLLLDGIPRLTELPPSTRLLFASGASLVVDVENLPCRQSADAVDRHRPGFGKGFVKAAMGRRGLVAWVEREGGIAVGDAVAVHVPTQRIWDPFRAAELPLPAPSPRVGA